MSTYTLRQVKDGTGFDPEVEFLVAPTDEQPVTLRGVDEVGQWMLTIYPTEVRLSLRRGDNDTWGPPVRFTGRGQ